MHYSYEYNDDYFQDHHDPFNYDWENMTEYFSTQTADDLKGLDYLNNVDYSLNSPMFSDELANMLRYFQGLPYEQRWDTNKWKHLKLVMDSLKVSKRELRHPQHFHKWVMEVFNREKCDLSSIDKLMEKTVNDAKDTYEVVDSFFKGWIGLSVQNPKTSQINPTIKKWGAYFWELHILTLCINAANEEELSLLKDKLKGEFVKSDSKKKILHVRMKNLGEVYISGAYTFFRDHSQVCDRNMVLMMKDVCSSRFQTLLSMIQRVDDLFGIRDWEKLVKLYATGDKILKEVGNKGYDLIKLVEPICNYRLTQLARELRPLIPDFPNFGNHVMLSVEEGGMVSPHMHTLYQQIIKETNLHVVLTFYGSFRHWGHPFVEYLEGLRKLHAQVTMEKEIDTEYVSKLASDLAFIVLRDKFKETKKWYVNEKLVPNNHPLAKHIKGKTWPTPKQIEDFGDKWHNLPLIKCFDIPDMIDVTNIYADKSHSMNRTEVLNYVNSNKKEPIPSRKVLNTFINSPATNWKDFLTDVNDHGLSTEDLIIGLKAKERELKRVGRFFTLMSWKLREYFVVTEYLIKCHFVPLFKGLTMADDLTTLTKKMMANTSGQGLKNYDRICIANHIDYEKWNNHQRKESNNKIFRVMGEFLGYPTLIERTHEFFEKSLVYFNERPDLMRVNGDILENRGNNLVCWNGQYGGLEGLRQKGWSIVNLLVIRREGLNRNTEVKTLAQGDNQVICTNYKLQKCRNDAELEENLQRICDNNETVMNGIIRGTKRLGLIINNDETMQSADYLCYGKTPVFRGNLCGLETKRWSRVTCVTNDQLPTLGNILSTVSSNSLTVAHFSASPMNAIVHYNLLGNFARNILEYYDPAIRNSVKSAMKDPSLLDTPSYKAAVIFLDPSLGGATGMSLNRFLIRNFPDPVTEGLTFWKCVSKNGSGWVKHLAQKAGNPPIAKYKDTHFTQLIEDPLSLNIVHSVSPKTYIKEIIRKSLRNRAGSIQNKVVNDAIQYHKDHNDLLVCFMKNIKPIFPRFLSEFWSATYLGLTEGVINLFENSRTIRNVFSNKLGRQLNKIIVKSEVQTLHSLIEFGQNERKMRGRDPTIWECSAGQADFLRFRSWGETVYGATVPHPLELINKHVKFDGKCVACDDEFGSQSYISVLIPRGLANYWEERGPYAGYLGSKTSETTSILQPWEKETHVPLLKRATKLRNAINWFIDKDSNLGKTIFGNLKALTGENWNIMTPGFKRTGSALHRFSCSRQSSGGFSAQSPIKPTRMVTTTDTLSDMGTQNYDFMYQSLLLYAQISAGELHENNPSQGYYHFHVSCQSCIRPIEEIQLESDVEFEFDDVSETLKTWKPDGTKWSKVKDVVEIPKSEWSELSIREKSFHIGRIQGFIFSDFLLKGKSVEEDTSLFPLVIQDRLIPSLFMKGILDGLMRASGTNSIARRSITEMERPRGPLLGSVMYLIDEISRDANLINIMRNKNFLREFTSIPHRIPPSYPLSNMDMAMMGKNYLKYQFKQQCIVNEYYRPLYEKVFVFSDVNIPEVIVSLGVSKSLLSVLYKRTLTKADKTRLRELKSAIHQITDPDSDLKGLYGYLKDVFRVDQEVRHACKGIPSIDLTAFPATVHRWKPELAGDILIVEIPYVPEGQDKRPKQREIPRIQNPTISGLRLFQCATGSHYKLRSIISSLKIKYRDALSGGDGSGGIGSMLLRYNPTSRLIFNSLLELENVTLKGNSPSRPSAIELIPEISNRCVNLEDVWEYPSDLSQSETWEYFNNLTKKHEMNIDLIVLDMEVRDPLTSELIELNLKNYCQGILTEYGSLIYKTYLNDLINRHPNVLDTVGVLFEKVTISCTDFTSSHSSEVYVIMQTFKTTNIKLFPDYQPLESCLHDFPVFKSPEVEFNRAVSISKWDMMAGIPKIYIPDQFIEVGTLLSSLGVETGTASLLGEMLRTKEESLSNPNYPLLVLIISINQILSITSPTKSTPPPPTDSQVLNVGALLTGFLIWQSIAENNLIMNSKALSLIEKHFPFTWAIQNTEKGYFRKYSFSGDFKYHKNFHLDSKMAAIGHVVRTFRRIFPLKEFYFDESTLNKLLQTFNTGLTTKLIHLTTDLFRVIDPGNRPLFGKLDHFEPTPNRDSDDVTFTS